MHPNRGATPTLLCFPRSSFNFVGRVVLGDHPRWDFETGPSTMAVCGLIAVSVRSLGPRRLCCFFDARVDASAPASPEEHRSLVTDKWSFRPIYLSINLRPCSFPLKRPNLRHVDVCSFPSACIKYSIRIDRPDFRLTTHSLSMVPHLSNEQSCRVRFVQPTCADFRLS